MKRRLLIVAVFLLAGAAVNVAVAWGCVALKPCTWSSWTSRWSNEALAPKEVAAVWWRFARPSLRSVLSASDYDGIRKHGFGLTSRWISNSFMHDQHGRVLTGVINGGASMHLICMVEAGWPARCFRRGWDLMPLDAAPRLVPQSAGVANRTGDAPQYRAIWPGFAVNTVFYAAVLWLLIPGPFALRRLIRIRRGLCPACAYPRSQSDVCSECGRLQSAR